MLFESVTVVKYILLFSFMEWSNMQFQDIVPVGHGYTICVVVRRHFYIICVFRTFQITEWLVPRHIQKVSHLNLVQSLAILAEDFRGFLSTSAQLTRYYLILVHDRFLWILYQFIVH
jgi:hypothetical protein